MTGFNTLHSEFNLPNAFIYLYASSGSKYLLLTYSSSFKSD